MLLTWNLLVLHTYFLIQVSFSTIVTDYEACKEVAKSEAINDADFIIVGLFPVHGHTSDNKFYYNHNGIIWSEAFRYFIDRVNGDPDILQNVRLGYVIYDTCSEKRLAQKSMFETFLDNPAAAVNRSQEIGTCQCVNQSKRRYIGVIGDAASSVSKVVSNILTGLEFIPQISYSSTSSALSNKKLYPSFLRTIPSDYFQVQLILDIVIRFEWRYVSVVCSDDVYGRLGMHNLLEVLKAHGVCIAVQALFIKANELEEIRIIQKLHKVKSSKVIILWAQRPSALAFLKQSSKQKLYGKTWIGTEGLGYQHSMLNLDPNVVIGMLTIAPFSGSRGNFYKHFANISANTYGYSSWIRHYFQLRNRMENGFNRERFGDFIEEFMFNSVGFVSHAVYALAEALGGILNI